MLQVCFLAWACLFSPLIWGNTFGVWQKSSLINQCLSACVVCVLAAKRQDMICTYLCSHSWHSLCSLPDKQGIPAWTTGVLTCSLLGLFLFLSDCIFPIILSTYLWCFPLVCLFSWESVGVCVWKGMHARTVFGLNQICPKASEENILTPAKIKGFIFHTFFSGELICNNRGVFLYRCLNDFLDLKFVCISMIS